MLSPRTEGVMCTFRPNWDNARALETLETVTVAVTRCSRDFQYLWANQAYANWIQRPLGEVIGRPISEVLGKDAFEALLPHFKRVLAGEEVHYEQETNFQGIDQRWISATYTPTLDPNGIADGWVAVVVDITERRRAAQALCESEERLRLAAQAGRMFAYSWDAATDVIERSGESAEILGVEQKAAATGSAISAMVYPADKERLGAALAKLSIDNPRLQITYRMVRPDGAVIWLERNSCAYFDERGKIKRIIGMVLDVTKRRRAEEALRRSEERLRLAQWAARIGTFDLNLRTGVDIWTPETEALYGLPPGGFAGTLTAFENLIHPDDQKRVVELTHEMMRTGQPMEGEWRVVWPDGGVHWIASRGQVFMDESGEPSRMLGVNLDITERKRAEEALSGMTRKLVEAQEQERIRIARELHDDISQRLALLAIDLDRVRGNYNDLPSEVRDHMQELQRMTADISSRVYAMSHELHSLTPDPSDLAKSMRGWCREFGKRQKMEIIFSCDDLPRLSQGISLCLFRILQEALHNSAKHSGVERV